jgi:hypothetical protein
MRKGMNGLALQVQQALGRDPHAGDLYVFRGARGDLIKIIWHDGIGMSLYSKRLEHLGERLDIGREPFLPILTHAPFPPRKCSLRVARTVTSELEIS